MSDLHLVIPLSAEAVATEASFVLRRRSSSTSLPRKWTESWCDASELRRQWELLDHSRQWDEQEQPSLEASFEAIHSTVTLALRHALNASA